MDEIRSVAPSLGFDLRLPSSMDDFTMNLRDVAEAVPPILLGAAVAGLFLGPLGAFGGALTGAGVAFGVV